MFVLVRRRASKPPDCIGLDGSLATDEPDGRGRAPDHGRRPDAGRPQLPHPGIAAGLTELLAVRFDDERVMKEGWRTWSSKHSGELDLPAGRREQIEPADDEIHCVVHVVHGHRELVGPVAVAILEEDIAALFRRRLHDVPEGPVDEVLWRVIQHHADTRASRDIVARLEAFWAATRPADNGLLRISFREQSHA